MQAPNHRPAENDSRRHCNCRQCEQDDGRSAEERNLNNREEGGIRAQIRDGIDNDKYQPPHQSQRFGSDRSQYSVDGQQKQPHA